jgi:hypothetical protein
VQALGDLVSRLDARDGEPGAGLFEERERVVEERARAIPLDRERVPVLLRLLQVLDRRLVPVRYERVRVGRDLLLEVADALPEIDLVGEAELLVERLERPAQAVDPGRDLHEPFASLAIRRERATTRSMCHAL